MKKKLKRYMGVDLHRTRFIVCERNENGEEKLTRYHIMELDDFASKLGKNVELAVEATGNTKFFCDVVKKRVGKLVVINPHQFKVISKSVKKTDENDAKTIAMFLEKDMLPEIRMKDDLQAKISSLVQTREKLVQLRTALENKINNIFSSNMMPLDKESMSSGKSLRKILSFNFDPITNVELRVMVSEIRNLNDSIKELDDAIPLSVIGNIHDFSNKNKLAAYFGIVPRVNNSNETVHHGRITKNGSKIGRTTLVQCALIAKRYCKPLRDYHEGIKSRRGDGKANIALARKFLDIIYYTLKNDKVFEDFPTFKLAKS